jgi:hypothetical protein
MSDADAVAAVAPRTKNAPPMGRATVTVACKLPNGLTLHVFEESTVREQMFGGGTREVQQWFRSEEAYTLAGSAMSLDMMMSGDSRAMVVGGYALTSNIPTEFWEKWLEQNKHAPYVKGGFIFAHKSEASVRDQARDGAKLRTGMEPVDPDDPASSSPEFKRVKKAVLDEDDEEAGI